MEKGFNILEMEMCIRECTKMGILMDLANIIGKMVQLIGETSLKAWEKVKAHGKE